MAPRLAWLLMPATLIWLAWAGEGRADIYAFTDDAGVEHFSNMPADRRYALLMRTETDKPSVAAKARSARRGINGSLYAHERITIGLALTLCHHPEMFQLHHEHREGATGFGSTAYRLIE